MKDDRLLIDIITGAVKRGVELDVPALKNSGLDLNSDSAFIAQIAPALCNGYPARAEWAVTQVRIDIVRDIHAELHEQDVDDSLRAVLLSSDGALNANVREDRTLDALQAVLLRARGEEPEPSLVARAFKESPW